MAEAVSFWVFAVLALGSALAVVAMRNIVHAALMLVLNLLAIAGLYLTLQATFISIVQVLVYAGAIMVLFLFVVMLLGVDRDDTLTTAPRLTAVAVAGAALLAVALLAAFVGPYTSPASVCGADTEVAASSDAVRCIGLDEVYGEDGQGGVVLLGEQLFGRYTFPFELAALLLTVATIGAVILARRRDLDPEDLDPEDLDGSEPPPGAAGLGSTSSDALDLDPGTAAADTELVLDTAADDERED